jgi:hypothetical protein
MSTYYNYVRRGTESQVDWGKIGKQLTDEISRISKDRDTKREELDKLNTDLIRSASDVAVPEQEYVRNLVLNGTNEMKNLALTNNNLLKRGIITPSQYRMANENMKSGIANLDKAVKIFDTSYKESMERLASNQMGFREQKEKENLFNYGNLKDKTLYVAPDGNMYITSVDESGNPIADPKKIISTSTLAQGLGRKITPFDLNASLDKAVDSIGSVVEVLRKNGVLLTDSPKNNKQYIKARDLYIDSIMNDPNNVVDILGDFMGREDIEQDVNGNFIPTEEQKKEVREKVTALFDSRVSEKSTPMPIQQQSEGAGRAANKEAEIGKNLGLLIFGSGPESDVAARSLASQNSNIESITRDNGVIRITTADGNYQDFDQNREGMNAELLARDIVGYLMPSGISSIDQVISKAGISPTRPMSLAPIKYTKTQESQSFKPVAQTPILSEDGKSLVMASTALNLIDPDGGKEEEVQAIVSKIDPRLSVTTESNTFGKDRLTLYLDGQAVGSIDYDDSEDKVQLINLIDQARSQKKQGSTSQQTQSGQVDYTKV